MAAKLPAGEYIIKADAASRHRQLLDAINSGGSLKLPSIPGAGSVAIAAPTTNNNTFAPTITIGSAGTPAQNQDMLFRMEKSLKAMAREFLQQEAVRQMRPGGLLAPRI